MSEQQELGNHRQTGIQVIARAAEVMRVLGKNPQGMSLAEIAQEVGLPRSTVQRITNALAEEMLVEHAGQGRGVRLGPAFGQLIHQTQTDIISLTRPYMQNLTEQLQESVCLSSLSGDSIYVIARLVAERELRVVFPIGIHTPAYATASGKALLSELPEASIRELLPTQLPQITEKTLSLGQLLEQIATVRQEKVSVDIDECIEGVSSYSVALDTYLGLFSLAVILPTARFHLQVDVVRRQLLQCKQEIERTIGRAYNRRG